MSSSSRARRSLAVVATIIVATLALATPAGAHTELDFAVPGPGADVGGVVDRLELTYFGLFVSDPSVIVKGPEGITIPGEVTDLTDATVTYEMDPLEVEGQYIVEWRVTASDGVVAESAFAFTYDEDAPPLERPAPDVSWRGWIIGLTVTFLVAFGFLLLVRKAQSQRLTPLE